MRWRGPFRGFSILRSWLYKGPKGRRQAVSASVRSRVAQTVAPSGRQEVLANFRSARHDRWPSEAFGRFACRVGQRGLSVFSGPDFSFLESDCYSLANDVAGPDHCTELPPSVAVSMHPILRTLHSLAALVPGGSRSPFTFGMNFRGRNWYYLAVAAIALTSLIMVIISQDRARRHGLEIGMTRAEVGNVFDKTVDDAQFVRVYQRNLKEYRDNPVALIHRFGIRGFCLAKRETRVDYGRAGRVVKIKERWIFNRGFSMNF